MPMPMSLMDDEEMGGSPSHPDQTNEGEGEQGQEGGETALINSTVCPDCQPGDIIKLKVVKIMGEEYEVQSMGKMEDEEMGGGGGLEDDEAAPMPKGESLMD